jgi:hypothetical protein
VEPEDTAVSRQRLSEHLFLKTNTHLPIETLFDAMFLCREQVAADLLLVYLTTLSISEMIIVLLPPTTDQLVNNK